MVKGISRRVVVVDSPDPRFSSRQSSLYATMLPAAESPPGELVEEARRVARNYAAGDHSRLSRAMRDLNPALYTIMGAAGIGLVWLTVTLV